MSFESTYAGTTTGTATSSSTSSFTDTSSSTSSPTHFTTSYASGITTDFTTYVSMSAYPSFSNGSSYVPVSSTGQNDAPMATVTVYVEREHIVDKMPMGVLASIIALSAVVAILASFIVFQQRKNSQWQNGKFRNGNSSFRAPSQMTSIRGASAGAYVPVVDRDSEQQSVRTPTQSTAVLPRLDSSISSVSDTDSVSTISGAITAPMRPETRSTYTSTASSSSSSYPLATVNYPFVPTRPDELPLKIGEQVRVVASFDDGWALIESISDLDSDGVERGMVPLGCLAVSRPGSSEASSWDSERNTLSDVTSDRPRSSMSTTGRSFTSRTSSLVHNYPMNVDGKGGPRSAAGSRASTQARSSVDRHRDSAVFSDYSGVTTTTATTGELLYFTAGQYNRQRGEQEIQDPFADSAAVGGGR